MRSTTLPALVVLGVVLTLAACGGSPIPGPVEDVGLPTASVERNDEAEAEASASSVTVTDTPEDVSMPAGPALAGFLRSASIEKVLGELPEPTCAEAGIYASQECEWLTSDGSMTLELSISHDEAINESVETFDDHMATIMEGGDRLTGVGQSAFVGANPLSPGVRLAAFVGEGVHVWVTILGDGERDELREAAIELANELVAAVQGA